jgi:ketose-bisphosphate aldolase
MAIFGMNDILDHALQNGYAVGYFEAWDQYSLEAVLEAAEECESPSILGFGAAVTNQSWLERRGVEELAALARCLAERSSVPTAILFNEARTYAQALRGLYCGCNAVMLESSGFRYEENVAVTQRIVQVAHSLGATVEAELGHLDDASGPEIARGIPTDPELAAHFVETTGVDALAVSIGNVHMLTKGEAEIDLDLLTSIHEAISVPLVIHGGTGFPDSAVRPAIERGVAKFNYGTRLKRVFMAGMSEAFQEVPTRFNVHHYIGSRDTSDILHRGKAKMKATITELIELYGSGGQAASC